MEGKTKLKLFREQLGLSLAELRKQTQIPRVSYYNYEQGVRNPDVKVAIKIADALGVTDLRELWPVDYSVQGKFNTPDEKNQAEK